MMKIQSEYRIEKFKARNDSVNWRSQGFSFKLIISEVRVKYLIISRKQITSYLIYIDSGIYDI